MQQEQITTLTFLRYETFKDKVWGFGMMQFAHPYLAKADGLEFYKLMGSGKDFGLNLPDWSVYALLQVWENRASADAFFEKSDFMKKYQNRCSEVCTIFMKTLKSHGKWSDKSPFQPSEKQSENTENEPIAVITRATIRTSRLIDFWKYVPTSQKHIFNAPGLIFTKGVGEVPIKQMATFSLWENAESVNNFAYKSREHAKAIKLTRKLDWYSEELFARFRPIAIIGTWGGEKLIPGL
ncbi:MAG: DUF3291 domain-containing protein [Flavobacteriales bacterium]|nr:DUF3291 domain-containing protein [Flavobacteriales bacterium]